MRNKSFNILIFCICAVLIFSACAAPTNNSDQTANTKNTNIANAAPRETSNFNAVNSALENSNAAKSDSNSKEGEFSEANYPQIAQTIFQRVNEFRQSQGLSPLELNPIISEQAKEHSREMAQTPNTISHRNFEDRIHDIRQQMSFKSAAENVAENVGYENPAREAVEGWKKSPHHRKNMLGDYNQTGIGVAQSKNGRYFFTQMFWKSS